MKCDRCIALRTEGYEYPEEYCSIGIDDDSEYATDDGCTLNPMTIKKMVKEIDEAFRILIRDGIW